MLHLSQRFSLQIQLLPIRRLIEWLQATITYETFRVKFSSMSESTHTLQANMSYVNRCSCVFSPAGRKTWHTGMKVMCVCVCGGGGGGGVGRENFRPVCLVFSPCL